MWDTRLWLKTELDSALQIRHGRALRARDFSEPPLPPTQKGTPEGTRCKRWDPEPSLDCLQSRRKFALQIRHGRALRARDFLAPPASANAKGAPKGAPCVGGSGGIRTHGTVRYN